MEPRNDSTWLFVGVAAGCGVVVLAGMCIAGGLFFSLNASSAPRPPPITGYPNPYPPLPPLPPPTFLPLPPSLVPPPPPLPSGTSEAPGDRAPRTVRATITSMTGAAGVSVGQTCEFNVERRDSDDGAGFACNAQIVCGGHLLYGGPMGGFFPCTLFTAPTHGVVGTDPNTTGQDGDAAMSVDSVQSRLEIWDDASGANGEFRVIAHIVSCE